MEEYGKKFVEHDPRFAWLTEEVAALTFRVMGMSVGGQVAVRDGGIDLDMEVPLLLRAFQKKAVKAIDEEVQVWVGRARRGEL